MTFDQFLQYIFSGITNGSIYALTALCFTLVFNATHIINFSQGQMVMLGGRTQNQGMDAGVQPMDSGNRNAPEMEQPFGDAGITDSDIPF